MSVNNSATQPEQTVTALQIPFPTEPREWWRVAGSHAGTVPISVGEFFGQAGTISSQARHRRLKTFVLLTLLIFPVALFATETLAPQVAPAMRSRSNSVSWYFQSGQWRADIRTLRAACEFLLDDEPSQ